MKYECLKDITVNVTGRAGRVKIKFKKGDIHHFKTPHEYRDYADRMPMLARDGFFKLLSREYERDYKMRRHEEVLGAESRQKEEIKKRVEQSKPYKSEVKPKAEPKKEELSKDDSKPKKEPKSKKEKK